MRILVLLGLLLGWGVQLQAFPNAYIEDSKVKSFQEQFEAADAPTEAQITNRENWSCSVYGVKSRLQVKKKDSLYVFRKPSAEEAEIKNEGSQPFPKYIMSKEGLSGQIGNMLDVVRITNSNSLISEISVPSRGELQPSPSPLVPGDIKAIAKSDRTVIAYAVCN